VSSEKQKLKLHLTEFDLERIKDFAHRKYLDETPIPRMDGRSFVSYCWVDSVISFLNQNGYTDIEIQSLNEKYDNESYE